jgi:hypothetical protein
MRPSPLARPLATPRFVAVSKQKDSVSRVFLRRAYRDRTGDLRLAKP